MAATPQFLDKLEQVLPAAAPGIGYRKVHELVDLGAPDQVRHALRLLESQQRATSRLVPMHHLQIRLYRRIPAQSFEEI